MFVLSAECQICSSHAIPASTGQPGALHGHNFRIVAFVESAELDSRGFVLPPSGLRAALWEVVEPFDHRHLNDLDPFREGEQSNPPTPGVLARLVFGRLAPRVEDERVALRRVEVWSRADQCVAWERT